MLLLDFSYLHDANSTPLKMRDLYNFRLIVSSRDEDELEGEGDTILINYTFSKYCSVVKQIPELPKLFRSNSDKSNKQNPSDWILFTRGSAAGIGAKISDLLFNRYHIQNYDSIQIEAVANTIIIGAKEEVSDILVLPYSDLLLRALFETCHQYKDDTTSFLVNILDKTEERKDNYFLKLGEVKDLTINIPSIEKQKEIVRQYEEFQSHKGTGKEISIYTGVEMRELIINIQNSLLTNYNE